MAPFFVSTDIPGGEAGTLVVRRGTEFKMCIEFINYENYTIRPYLEINTFFVTPSGYPLEFIGWLDTQAYNFESYPESYLISGGYGFMEGTLEISHMLPKCIIELNVRVKDRVRQQLISCFQTRIQIVDR